MRLKWLSVIMVLFVLGCEEARVGLDKVTLLPGEEDAEAELGRQLKINREALLKGSTDQIRIDAATVMLFNEDPLARKILLDALKQSENIPARVAVCRALSQARAEQKTVVKKEDFILPLFDILKTDFDDSAKYAAEAILIFDYDQISEPLEAIVTDTSLPVKARLNSIYALRLQPDMRAVFKLIDRLDDADEQVAAEAEKALRFLGTPVGKGAEEREQIRTELKSKGRDEFFKDLLIRREAKMRELQVERDRWQGRYLLALGKIYDAKSDDTAKTQFLKEHLSSPEAVIRLWSLEKVRQDRVGTRPNPKLQDEIGAILVDLISDKNKDVRLRTAKLLFLMGELNSAEHLLAQLEVEQDEEVKMALFEALGYAFVPNPKVKIPDEARKQALEWTTRYLTNKDPEKTQKGAEVMKKLLEQDGLSPADVDRYLGLLVERYKRDNTGEELRGELLGTMAGLCAPQSVYNAQSQKQFKSLFEDALVDTNNLVREAAVEGLIYIDKTEALKRLRKDFVNDPSDIVRKKLIDLAGKVGGKEDLVWLAEKLGSNAESELAWQAMLKIFNGADTDVLSVWIDKLITQSSKTRLSDEQKISFLEIAERKAVGENRPKVLKDVRQRLARLYVGLNQFERAADYLGRLNEAAQTHEQKEAILSDLLNVYLRWPKVELAAKLVENYLLEKDLEPESFIISSIENSLSHPQAGVDPNVVLSGLLGQVKVNENRPMWEEQKNKWIERVGKETRPGGAGG